jgi:hypothetical protein
VVASAQVISEGCPTVALYVAGSAIECMSPPVALHLATVPLLYRNSLPIPNAQSRARPRPGRLTWKVCLVYLDDIIVYSKIREEHLVHLDAVIHRLYCAGLSLNLKKCHFFRSEVSYLGHVIGPGTLAVAEKNTRALRNAKSPSTQTELRSFLGLCNVYRRFVKGFAKIAAPLNSLLRKGESPRLNKLNEDQLRAFEALRQCLLTPPILAFPNADGQFTLDTDASSDQIG